MKYSEVSRILTGQVEALCEKLLPGGTRKGQTYYASSISGNKGQSLQVTLSGQFIGKWKDFNGGAHGDLIDLWAHSQGLALNDAYDDICKWLNIDAPKFGHKQKEFKKPVKITSSISDGAIKYLSEVRKISADTIQRYKVGSVNGALVFNFYREGELINAKTLPVRRDENGKKLPMRFETGCEQCLFGWDAFTSRGRSITICEGEIDAMSLAEYGIKALSVPCGASGLTWIENDFDNLGRFDKIYLCFDNDEAGKNGALAHAKRLGIERCYNVVLPKNDANECLTAGVSKEEIENAFNNAESWDPEQLQDPKSFEAKVLERIFPSSLDQLGYDSPWHWFNEKIFFDKSGLSVWTGTNGHGKTQFLNHLAVYWMSKGAKLCIASLELDPDETLVNMIPVLSTKNTNPRVGTTLTREFAVECINWLHEERMWFYDEFGGAKADELIKILEYAHRKYGIDVFIIDSLSLINIDDDNYNDQSAFVKDLVRFKKRNNCHVHLVVHPKKMDDEQRLPGKFDFKGSGTITNVADNCFSVWRNKAKEEAVSLQERGVALDENKLKLLDAPDCYVSCVKQRKDGHEGKFGFMLDLTSKQYLGTGHERPKPYVHYSKVKF